MLYVNDGQDRETVHLRQALQGLIAQGAIRAPIVVAIDMPRDRMGAYGLSDREHGASVVAIHGVEVAVAAEVRSLPSLSAHADRDELVRWARALSAAPRRVFLNHGEDPARKALARALQVELGWPLAELPLHGQAVEW